MNRDSSTAHIPPQIKQTRKASLIEAVANVFVGYWVAVIANILVFHWFNLGVTLSQSMQIGAIMTVVSIARSFALRRVFEGLRVRFPGKW